MDNIVATKVYISWITPIEQKCPIKQSLILMDLAKPFRLGSEVHKFDSTLFIIDKVESSSSMYEFTNSGKLMKTNKHQSIEVENNLYFVAKPYSDIMTKSGLKKLFGFQDIDTKITAILHSLRNSITCLFGPCHSGKSTFMNILELREANVIFSRAQVKHYDNKKYFMDFFDKIEKTRKKTVVYISQANYLSEFDDVVTFIYERMVEILANSNIDVKVILRCDDIDSLHPLLLRALTERIKCSAINNKDRLEYLTHLITQYTGTQSCGEGLEAFSKSLVGYGAGDVFRIIHNVYSRYKELTMERLWEAKADKKYQPHHLSPLIADIDRLSWSDIGGYEDVKKQIIEQIQEPIKIGEEITTGILLYGPPGCSKTMFARALASECKIKLFAVKPSNILSCYHGESEKNLRNIMMTAEDYAPSIIFFDEIDLLLPKTDESNGHSVTDALSGLLLTFMDGVGKGNQVIVMAATNDLSNLDEALLRPGRMDLLIEIDLPDQSSRESILKIVFNDKQFEVDREIIDNITAIAERLEGKNGADIVDIGKKIKKFCLRQYDDDDDSIPQLTMDHVRRIVQI